MSDRITELAFQLADDAASSDIETMCIPVGGEPGTIDAMRTYWFDIASITDPEDAEFVAVAVEYLDGRGLLKRHPENTNWVRPRHDTEIAEAA